MIENTKPKKFCFILMPFTDDFDDTYSLGIKQSCLDAGAYCERVDEQIFKESILERIYNQISKADIIIADMTGRNPNVFYEVGYAHALGKPTILLTNNSDDIPFDLKHYPHIVYNNKITKLKEELTKKLLWFIENTNKQESNYKIDIEMFYNSKNLSKEDVIISVNRSNWAEFILTMQNNTFNTLSPSDYRIGIITDGNYTNLFNEDSKTATLPDGSLLHMLPTLEDILYPTSFTSFNSKLKSPTEYFEEQKILIRLFTSIGTRDYPIIITWE
jgi:hypothetical protein